MPEFVLNFSEDEIRELVSPLTDSNIKLKSVTVDGVVGIDFNELVGKVIFTSVSISSSAISKYHSWLIENFDLIEK